MNQFNMFDQPAASRIEWARIMFMETATYNDMVRRPITSHVQTNTHEALLEATGGKPISHNVIAGLAPEIIRPMGQYEGYATIENGWQERRMRFMAEVVIRQSTSNVIERRILSGYTDHFGVTGHGHDAHIDPMLKLYINNITVLRDYETPVGGVIATTTQFNGSQQVLNGGFREGAYGRPGAGTDYSVSSADVVGMVGTFAMMGEGATFGNDARASFQDSPVRLVNRADLLPGRYLATALESYRRAYTEQGYDASEFHIADEARAIALAAGNTLTQTADPLMDLLNRETEWRDLGRGYLTYGEILQMDHSVDSRVQVTVMSPPQRAKAHVAGQTTPWTAGGNEGVVASILASEIPALMSMLTLTRVTFTCTNATIDGYPYLEPVMNELTPKSFSNAQNWHYLLQEFKSRFLIEVLPVVTRNGQMIVNLSIDVDLQNEARFGISVNGSQEEEFAAPVFADHAFSPLITANFDNVSRLGSDMTALVQNVIQSPVDMGGNLGYNNSL